MPITRQAPQHHRSSSRKEYMNGHIFIDNSNTFGGAQRAALKIESGAVWISVRIYYKNLFTLVERGITPITRLLAGSVPPGNDALWESARRHGYNTDLLQRIEKDDGRLVEQGVDEIAHLKIANALLDYEAPQTLVLVTGDGNDADFGTSFTKQAECALKRGWNVSIWSWRAQLSGKFARLAASHPGKMTINAFDPYFKEITFLQEGVYYVNGASIRIGGRVVSKLRQA